jgi:hypothetical protein
VWLAFFLRLCGTGSEVAAADFKLTTAVAVNHEYNEAALSDNITSLSPRLGMDWKGERYTLQADGKLEWRRYHEYDHFNTMDQWYNGYYNALVTERWRVGAEGHAVDDSRPDRDIEETGLLLDDNRRRRLNAGASSFFTGNEVFVCGLILNVGQENYEDPETSDRKDYSAMIAATFGLGHWLEGATGRMNLGYSHYDFSREFSEDGSLGFFDILSLTEDESRVDSLSLTVGAERALTERINMAADVGGRYTRSIREIIQTVSFSPPSIDGSVSSYDIKNESYGFVGNATFGLQGERSRASLYLSHDLQPVSGSNATANRTTIQLNGNVQLLKKLWANAYLQWYWNQNDYDDPTQDDIDTQSWNSGCGLRWVVNRYFDVAANYTYTIYEDHEAGTTAYRNKAVVQLEAHHTWLDE